MNEFNDHGAAQTSRQLLRDYAAGTLDPAVPADALWLAKKIKVGAINMVFRHVGRRRLCIRTRTRRSCRRSACQVR